MSRILLVYGGESAESEVSRVTAEACAGALAALGHELRLFDPAGDEPPVSLADYRSPGAEIGEGRARPFGRSKLAALVAELDPERVDLVYNCWHGGAGEDGRLAALCEWLGLPISSSPSLAAAQAMDKDFSKRLMRRLGIPTADWGRFAAGSACPENLPEGLAYPLVLKPNSLGSSVGIFMVESRSALKAAWSQAVTHGDALLLEACVPGRELTCAMLGERVLPTVEIRAGEGWYDYRHKYQGGCSYHCPAEIDEALDRRLKAWTKQLCLFMGCRGITRTDWRLDPEGHPYCLEVNTVPGMTSSSLVPKAAAAESIDFRALVRESLQLALRDGA